MTNETNEQTNEQVEQPNNEEAFNACIQKELNNLPKADFEDDDIPNFKFEEENKIYSIKILPEEFGEWIDSDNCVKKKIIKIEVRGVKYKWWLNTKNPVYSEIVKGIVVQQMEYKVMRQGDKKQTKYIIVKD